MCDSPSAHGTVTPSQTNSGDSSVQGSLWNVPRNVHRVQATYDIGSLKLLQQIQFTVTTTSGRDTPLKVASMQEGGDWIPYTMDNSEYVIRVILHVL